MRTPVSDNPTTTSLDQALDVLRRTQSDDGSWAGDYSGPLFLLPMYVRRRVRSRFATR